MANQRTQPGLLDNGEIQQAFNSGKWGDELPPILSVAQAARLAHVPRGTLYDWSSRDLLAGCAKRKGKRLLIWRDRFVQWLFT